MYSTRLLAKFVRPVQRVHASSPCLFRHSTCVSAASQSLVGSRSITTARRSDGILSQQPKVLAELTQESQGRISNVTMNNNTEILEVNWIEGGSDGYPYIWLRDNCQCSECYHATSNSRKLLISQLRLDIFPVSVLVNAEGTKLDIEWSDGHRGYCSAEWLQERSFSDIWRQERDLSLRPHQTLWGAEFINKVPEKSFPELLEDDRTLLKFLQEVEEYGLVVLHDTPCQRGQVEVLSNHVGFLKRTHHGVTFSVQQKVDANNLAYTANTLNLHTDFPYITYIPGIQVLHCITQTEGEGGDNLLVDSFNAAQQLKKLHPEKFEVLTTIPVDFKDKGVDPTVGYEFHTKNQQPVINLHRDGRISHVVFNQSTRDSTFNVSSHKVKDWYDAMLTFGELLYHPENVITYKMKGGDTLVFDNSRVLHGHKAYHMDKGKRELEGCSWDWDMARSRRRVLEAKFGTK